MNKYLDFLKQNNLKNEYSFVNKTRGTFFMGIHKLPKLKQPINETHRKLREKYFKFIGLNQTGGSVFVQPESIKTPLTKEETVNLLNEISTFVRHEMDLPKNELFVKENHKKTPREIENENLDNEISSVEKDKNKVEELYKNKLEEYYKSGKYDVIDTVEPRIFDLYQYKITFDELSSINNSFMSVLARIGDISGKKYSFNMIKEAIINKYTEDPDLKDMKELLLEDNNLFNQKILEIAEELFDIKFIIVSRVNTFTLNDSEFELFHEYKQSKKESKNIISKGSIGQRKEIEDFIGVNIRKEIKNNKLSQTFLHKYETKGKIKGFRVEDGQILCHNYNMPKRSKYVLLGYINDTTFQIGRINGMRQITNLPKLFLDLIDNSCKTI